MDCQTLGFFSLGKKKNCKLCERGPWQDVLMLLRGPCPGQIWEPLGLTVSLVCAIAQSAS